MFFCVFSFSRVALCVMVLHYIVEFVFHLARLLYFAEKNDFANTGYVYIFMYRRLFKAMLQQQNYYGVPNIHKYE